MVVLGIYSIQCLLCNNFKEVLLLCKGERKIIKTFEPDEIAIEKVFMHRNADSALKLGQARGAAITACATKDIPLFEYSANQVKQACVGKGHATKEQVQHMIKILKCRTLPNIVKQLL